MRRGGQVHALATIAVVGFAVAALTRAVARPHYRSRGHRPPWSASYLQHEHADRFERAAAFYRAGRRGRAEGILMSALIDWDLAALCAARFPDLRAQALGDLLAAPRGADAFRRELRRSDSSECAAVLGLLAAALRSVPDPTPRDRVA